MCLQDSKFSAQVASLEAEVRGLKADNAALGKDNKACYNQIRAKDKELDNAAKEVEHARRTELHNKVCLVLARLLHGFCKSFFAPFHLITLHKIVGGWLQAQNTWRNIQWSWESDQETSSPAQHGCCITFRFC